MKTSSTVSRFSRRKFLAGTAAVLATPTFIPASALGKAGRPSPSERIVIGIVGWGMMGPGNTSGMMGQKRCQVVAARHFDSRQNQQALDGIVQTHGHTDC